MRLTMKQRQAVTAVTAQRYRQGNKKVKRQILDEFCKTTGYSRGYARFVLRNHGRQVWLRGKKVVVGDARQRQQTRRDACEGRDADGEEQHARVNRRSVGCKECQLRRQDCEQ